MSYRKIYAKFIRGGTSKGVYIKSYNLPEALVLRHKVLLRLMGSPDKSGLQLDGMGGGINSTSKVAIISKITIDDQPYLNFNFGQVSIREDKIDFSGNCGNLAAGLFEFVKGDKEYEDCIENIQGHNNIYSHALRVWQENKKHKMCIYGNINACDEIFVEFKNIIPENSNLFPTGNVVDQIKINKDQTIEATLLSGANPLVIIRPESLNLNGTELPQEINYNLIKDKLDLICQEASKKMGMTLSEAFRVAWVSKPATYFDTANNIIKEESVDIVSRITASQRIHHAHTGTGAVNIAVACMIKGTVANSSLNSTLENLKNNSEVRIGHPGGIITCNAEVEYNQNSWGIKSAGFIRTARLLMEGNVFI